MEGDARDTAERVRKTDAGEREARILRHPDEAGRLSHEPPGLTGTDRETRAGHVSALVRVPASRVAERETTRRAGSSARVTPTASPADPSRG